MWRQRPPSGRSRSELSGVRCFFLQRPQAARMLRFNTTQSLEKRRSSPGERIRHGTIEQARVVLSLQGDGERLREGDVFSPLPAGRCLDELGKLPCSGRQRLTRFIPGLSGRVTRRETEEVASQTAASIWQKTRAGASEGFSYPCSCGRVSPASPLRPMSRLALVSYVRCTGCVKCDPNVLAWSGVQ